MEFGADLARLTSASGLRAFPGSFSIHQEMIQEKRVLQVCSFREVGGNTM